jgi:hypothetical protein
MNQEGWIFMVGIWAVLTSFVAWSYKVLLSEPHIPMGYYEDEHHHETCEFIGSEHECPPDNDDDLITDAVAEMTEDEKKTGT